MNKSIKQLKSLFEETITTLSIAESVQIQTQETYLDYATKNNFDSVLFRNQSESDLLCWDRFSDSPPRSIKHNEIVTDSTPLLDVVRLLVIKKRLFVHEKNSIQYIVTLSDLEKMPVRIWLFGIISLTEMELKYLIDKVYQSDHFLDKLSEGRKSKTLALYIQKMESNSEIKIVDCLQYCDIESIIKKSPEIKIALKNPYTNSDLTILSEAEKLRNIIAHSQKIDMDWAKILEITELLESLLNDIIVD